MIDVAVDAAVDADRRVGRLFGLVLVTASWFSFAGWLVVSPEAMTLVVPLSVLPPLLVSLVGLVCLTWSRARSIGRGLLEGTGLVLGMMLVPTLVLLAQTAARR